MNSPLRPDFASAPYRQISRVARSHDSTRDTADSPPRTSSMMRKFEVSSLASDGEVRESSHIVPAHPLFEDAASAFVRGTIVQTDTGPMAIEDLLPGDRLIDVEGIAIRVMWIGATMIVPGAENQRDQMRHTWRITADKFGVGRPMPDLMLGQGARLLVDRPSVRMTLGADRALMPIADLSDEMGLIRLTPPSPVRVFHVALEHHAAFNAAGLEVESYHPGEHAPTSVGRNMLSLWLSLFPHIETPQDFGPMAFPRATQALVDELSAA